MKFTMDEAMKHRVVGIAVIVSIALVFLPAMIKKNNQRLEEKRIAIELPAKPPLPQTAKVDEPRVFAETKVAHVDLDTQHVLTETEQEVKQHPIEEPKSIQDISQLKTASGNEVNEVKPKILETHTSNEVGTPAKKIVVKASKPQTTIAKNNSTKIHVKSDNLPIYAVQIGVFSDSTNAKAIQRELNRKGYQSRLVNTKIGGKPAVKVVIGSVASAKDANQLKVKLAKEQNIKGFVIKGVG